ncbi:hypothetical protein L2E82_18276 [Cichorium intybus]|uniref:Uncharacterized protein n=1 Tax=Cichorium intybus TaxID=13427 RepID=A0ACB9FB19_CICIN|nr:hypothetical protein L2E82_18276 [Cichorium intybus]
MRILAGGSSDGFLMKGFRGKGKRRLFSKKARYERGERKGPNFDVKDSKRGERDEKKDQEKSSFNRYEGSRRENFSFTDAVRGSHADIKEGLSSCLEKNQQPSSSRLKRISVDVEVPMEVRVFEEENKIDDKEENDKFNKVSSKEDVESVNSDNDDSLKDEEEEDFSSSEEGSRGGSDYGFKEGRDVLFKAYYQESNEKEPALK